jgi:hypothetical protein
MDVEAQMTRAYHPIFSAERSQQAGIRSNLLGPVRRPAMFELVEGFVPRLHAERSPCLLCRHPGQPASKDVRPVRLTVEGATLAV